MEDSPLKVLTVATAPYLDQWPGCGGLRRRVGVFQGNRHYLHNFLQSVFSCMDLRERQGCTLVVGGDGRFFNRTAMELVVQMAAANGVGVCVCVRVCVCACVCVRVCLCAGGG